MSCRKWERLISDSVDGALTGTAAGEFEAHLAECPACRAYRARLERIHREAAAGDLPAVPAGYWDDFSSRLLARLGRAREAACRPGSTHRGWRWAWLAVPAAAAGVLLFLQVFRPAPVALPELPGFEQGLDAASQAALEDAALADDFDLAVLSSLREETGLVSPEELPPATDDPGFWDSLTDDEAALIDREIVEELRS